MEFPVELYGKDSGGKLKYWSITTVGNEIHVSHGKLGGKIQTKVTVSEPKNVGRSNETTAEEQALVEAEAKVVKQLKDGYFYTKEEALSFVEFSPMKAQNYKDYAHKVTFPCYYQHKLNGMRLMFNEKGEAFSKSGEPLTLPPHMECIREFAISQGGLDGEIWAGTVKDGGLSLQQIISAFRKENENTHKLRYWVYDKPTDVAQCARIDELIDSLYSEKVPSVVAFNLGTYVTNREEGDEEYEESLRLGMEGGVYRNVYGFYEHGKRSYDLIKRKPRLDAEALVLSYTLDKNDEPVYLVEAVNGEQKSVKFKLKMKVPDGKEITGLNYRRKENADELVGKHITYEYEELSDSSPPTPTKGVGICVRETVKNGEGRY